MPWLLKTLLAGIAGWFSNGGVGHKVGTAITDGAAIVALAPLAYWFLAHKDDIAVTLTWGQISLFGLLIFAFIKIAHFTRWGKPEDRTGL